MAPVRWPRLLQIVLSVYFLEAGSLLVVAPWSRLWSQTIVLAAPQPLQGLLASGHFRGFLTGIGLLHIVFSVREFWDLPSRETREVPPSVRPGE